VLQDLQRQRLYCTASLIIQLVDECKLSADMNVQLPDTWIQLFLSEFTSHTKKVETHNRLAVFILGCTVIQPNDNIISITILMGW